MLFLFSLNIACYFRCIELVFGAQHMYRDVYTLCRTAVNPYEPNLYQKNVNAIEINASLFVVLSIALSFYPIALTPKLYYNFCLTQFMLTETSNKIAIMRSLFTPGVNMSHMHRFDHLRLFFIRSVLRNNWQRAYMASI